TRSVFEVDFGPVRGDDGSPIGAVLVARDITALAMHGRALADLNAQLEQRIAERTAALDRQRDTLRLCLDAARLGVWEVELDPDGDGALRAGRARWDERACEVLGLDPQAQPSGLDALAQVHVGDRELVRERVRHALRL